MTDSANEDGRFGWKEIGGAICVVLVVEAVFATALICLAPNDWRMTERGQFGDMFGALNAAFSGLAFCGIIYTIFLQRRELVLQRRELRFQREELEATRKELKKSAKAQDASQRALHAQAEMAVVAARLSSINNMIQVQENRLALLRTKSIHSMDDQRNKNEIEIRLGQLYAELEQVYGAVSTRSIYVTATTE